MSYDIIPSMIEIQNEIESSHRKKIVIKLLEVVQMMAYERRFSQVNCLYKLVTAFILSYSKKYHIIQLIL